MRQCGHRFCAECLETCLRTGKKECPACRGHLPSRRATRCVRGGGARATWLNLSVYSVRSSFHSPAHNCARRDAGFNSLIRKLYPDLAQYEQREEKKIAATNKAQLASAMESESRALMRARQKVRAMLHERP